MSESEPVYRVVAFLDEGWLEVFRTHILDHVEDGEVAQLVRTDRMDRDLVALANEASLWGGPASDAGTSTLEMTDGEYELLAWYLNECAVPERLEVERRDLRAKVERA